MNSSNDTPKGWVAPFGYPRINACSRLPVAFRSVPRPSSPPGAKASTECPYYARDRDPIEHVRRDPSHRQQDHPVISDQWSVIRRIRPRLTALSLSTQQVPPLRGRNQTPLNAHASSLETPRGNRPVR